MKASERMIAVLREAEEEARAKGLLRGPKTTRTRKPRRAVTRVPSWLRWALAVETVLLAAFLWGNLRNTDALVPAHIDAPVATTPAPMPPPTGPLEPAFHKDGVDYYPAYNDLKSKHRR